MLIRMRLTSHIPVQCALYQGKILKTNLREDGHLRILMNVFIHAYYVQSPCGKEEQNLS